MPVALNLYKIRAAKEEGGDFFRSVQKQKYQYQGLWLVAPDGRVLATAGRGNGNSSDWARVVLADLQAGMNEFGTIAPAPRRPGEFAAVPGDRGPAGWQRHIGRRRTRDHGQGSVARAPAERDRPTGGSTA